jgi:hypothetical protein
MSGLGDADVATKLMQGVTSPVVRKIREEDNLIWVRSHDTAVVGSAHLWVCLRAIANIKTDQPEPITRCIRYTEPTAYLTAWRFTGVSEQEARKKARSVFSEQALPAVALDERVNGVYSMPTQADSLTIRTRELSECLTSQS